jgi:RNA polymerase sigma-70 factor (sigma-E family)
MSAITAASRSRLGLGGGTGVMRGTAGLDENAVSMLYATHRLALVRLAVLLVDDQASAEDVVQDAFVGLHRHRSQLRDPEAAVGYLRTAVVNGARSALRRRGTQRRFLQRRTTPEYPEEADSAVLLAEEHRTVLRAVRGLPQRQQEILALRYWSNLTEAEIAQTLGISRGAVKSQASRAIDKLETIMKGSER